MWGLLSSLQLDGPRTVPQIALARGVARQRIHKKIVDEAHAADLVLFRDNPDHKRSRIVDLTRGGSNMSERIDKELRDAARKIGDAYDIRDLDAALRGSIRPPREPATARPLRGDPTPIHRLNLLASLSTLQCSIIAD